MCVCGRGGGGSRGYAGKVVDINRMTKNPNPGFFLLFPFFVSVGWGRGQSLAGQGGGGVGKGVGAIIFICDPLYQPNTHCFTFS